MRSPTIWVNRRASLVAKVHKQRLMGVPKLVLYYVLEQYSDL